MVYNSVKMEKKEVAKENIKDKNNQSLMKAAWLIAVVIVFSKIIGFFRDIIIANFYGASLVSDAYFYAYQIPSFAIILLGGVGGPFHSAIVSIFSKIMAQDSLESRMYSKKLFNTIVTVTLIIFVSLSLFIFMFSDIIMRIIISGASNDLINLASLHLKIMSPILIAGGLVGIYYGILVTFKEFLIPNISPTLVSLSIILIISLTKSDESGVILAIATTIGAILQFLFQIPKAKKLGYKLRFSISEIKSKDYKNFLELLFPAILSSTIGQIYIYVDMFFSSQLETGAWTAIGYANRVFQFPVGILVTAFLVPLFPLFSRLVAQNDINGIRYYFNRGVGLLNYVGFPILLAILLFSNDIVSLIFERGAFNNQATSMVVQALIYLSVALLPYIFRDSLTRIYYAFNDSKTPFYIAMFSIIVKIILNLIFVEKLGIGGITLSTSLVTFVNALLLGIFIRKKIRIGYSIYLKNFIKMLIGAMIAFMIGYYLNSKWIFELNLLTTIIKCSSIFAIVCVIYALTTNLLGLEYTLELYNRIKLKIINRK